MASLLVAWGKGPRCDEECRPMSDTRRQAREPRCVFLSTALNVLTVLIGNGLVPWGSHGASTAEPLRAYRHQRRCGYSRSSARDLAFRSLLTASRGGPAHTSGWMRSAPGFSAVCPDTRSRQGFVTPVFGPLTVLGSPNTEVFSGATAMGPGSGSPVEVGGRKRRHRHRGLAHREGSGPGVRRGHGSVGVGTSVS